MVQLYKVNNSLRSLVTCTSTHYKFLEVLWVGKFRIYFSHFMFSSRFMLFSNIVERKGGGGEVTFFFLKKNNSFSFHVFFAFYAISQKKI